VTVNAMATSFDSHYDAVIVGARCAGAATAMLLARHGLHVLAIDRGRYGTDTLSTHALMRGGVLQLQRWGLLEQVMAVGTPPVRRVVFHYGTERLPVTLKPYAGVDALVAPRRKVLDALLVGAAEDAGVQFRFGTAVTDVIRGRGGRVAGVVVRDHSGNRREERAALVVGADGRQSLVAEQVRAATLLSGTHAAAYLYGYWPAGHVAEYHWYYGDGLSAGVIPTNDGQACVFVAGSAPVIAAQARRSRADAVASRLLQTFDDPLPGLVTALPEGPVRFFHGKSALLRRASGPGWALVGDSGWWKDPLSTHGITDALRDAELLARAVVDGAGSERALLLAMRRYEAQRNRSARAMHPVVDRLASHQWDLPEAHRLLRALSSVMADCTDTIRELDESASRTA
jgi:2-polyprenyl-6-methoxyphenol hydroxylase-like FAD-dependent oxidoreductase